MQAGTVNAEPVLEFLAPQLAFYSPRCQKMIVSCKLRPIQQMIFNKSYRILFKNHIGIVNPFKPASEFPQMQALVHVSNSHIP